jgi:hypothetical protein
VASASHPLSLKGRLNARDTGPERAYGPKTQHFDPLGDAKWPHMPRQRPKSIPPTEPLCSSSILINDFLADGGKLWPLVAEVANAVGLHENLRSLTKAARKAGLPIFIVPHHRYEPDDLKNWDHPTPHQLGSAKLQVFAKGSSGGEWFPELSCCHS